MLKRLKFSKKKAWAQWVGLDIYAFKKKSYSLSMVENAYPTNLGQNKSP